MHWSGGAYVDFIRWQPALDKLDRGGAQDIGGEPEVDREKLVSLAPAVLTIYPFGDPLQGVNLKHRVPVVPIMEYLESQPLGRAEWMRVMGWMMGDEAAKQSDLKFLEIASAYERLRHEVAQRERKPRVFTGSVQQGTWHAPGSASFIATLLEDAGLTYILDSDSGRENVEVALEEMVVLSQTADAWGMVTHHPGQLSRSAFLDADDIWSSKKLKIQVDHMLKYDSDLSYTSYYIINKNSKKIAKRKISNKIDYPKLLKSCEIGLSSVMVKKQILKDVKFSDLKTQEDYALWLKLLRMKYKFLPINKYLVSWRKTENSLSSNIWRKLIDSFTVYYKYEKKNFINSIYSVIILSTSKLLKINYD